eukprot:gnl/Chilomastix_cuspidata/1006.p1 GENE.gnl/Chilomastix_cuspidata/1006~~gnl/Chilomastix_cuspidata/1006.p1  ORF type:complete len:495 (+),score=188.27 gnl/Chilomastix_cuspidata/1006:1968-3452(+)
MTSSLGRFSQTFEILRDRLDEMREPQSPGGQEEMEVFFPPPEREGFYKLANNDNISRGTIRDVVAAVPSTRQFDPILANYLAFVCSLLCDPLTAPAFAIRWRLGWTQTAEHFNDDPDTGIEALFQSFGEFVVLAFRSRLSWDETVALLDDKRVATTCQVPARLAAVEQCRMRAKKRGEPFSLADVRDPPWGRATGRGDPRVQFHARISGAYSRVSREVCSFVREALGHPLEMLLALGPELRTAREKARILIAGHGLGGAVAQLCALDFASLYGADDVCCYTFGQPRVGNARAAEFFLHFGGQLFRVTNATDRIVHMPTQTAGFFHPKHTRVAYGFPPRTGREGFLGMRIRPPVPSDQARQMLRRKQHASRHQVVTDLRVHTCYCGVLFPMYLDPADRFPFELGARTRSESPDEFGFRDLVPACAANIPRTRDELQLAMQDVAPSMRRSVTRWLFATVGEPPPRAAKEAAAAPDSASILHKRISAHSGLGRAMDT